MGKVNWHSLVKFEDWMILPDWLRGEIQGKLRPLKSKEGRKPTNKEYARERGITKRQASKLRK